MTNAQPPFHGPSLRLVRETSVEAAGPFKFERRTQPRWQASAHATLMTTPDPHDLRMGTDPEAEDDGHRKLSGIRVRDRSVRGIGAWSPTALAEGERVTIFVPGAGSEPPRRLIGYVARCRAEAEGGFDLGVRLEADEAAA